MYPYPSKNRDLFRPASPRSNPYRVLLWLGLILLAIFALLQFQRGKIKPLFLPTSTPTRAALSYIEEAEAYFAAGKLDDPATEQDAIDTYRLALEVDPTNARVWAELARIQTYSSSMQSTDNDRLTRLQEALQSANQAITLAPDESLFHAILAFVLDWNASSNLITSEQRQDYLNEAEREAVRAYQLDPNNAIALAFYAEVLVDQLKWAQAEQYAADAVSRAPDSRDVHRVYATVLENVGKYTLAIEEYKAAVVITPNFTYLYIRIGVAYRTLGNRTELQGLRTEATQLYEAALSYFDQAARINEQLGVKDPQPYIAIAKTYTQMGQALVASRNAEKALIFDPTSSDTYGQLGMIYVQSKNYESALQALKCAVEGCSAEENGIAIELVDQGLMERSVAVDPLPLTNLNVAYYYIRYGSVLAYMSQPGDGSCEKSLVLMTRLREFSDDPDLLANVAVNEALCYRLLGTPTP